MLIKRLLAIVAICLSLAAYVLAQDSKLEASYARWRSEALKQNPEVPHIALTLAAVRSGNGDVVLDVLNSGRPIDLKLQIEPGKITGADGQKNFVPTGEKVTGSQKLRDLDRNTVGPVQLSLTIPATAESDAVRVAWLIPDNGSEKPMEILVPISSKYEASTVGIIQNSGTAARVAP